MADTFNRRKMQWLNSIFYEPGIQATACRIAYVIGDHLNRATGDSWLAQTTIALKIGKSPKTVNRALKELQAFGKLRIRRGGPSGTLRYSPPDFETSEQQVSPVQSCGQSRPARTDTTDRQSYLENLPRTYLRRGDRHKRQVRPRKMDRGRYELEIVARLDSLGVDGMSVLSRLAEIDDQLVTKLCELQSHGGLSEEDLRATIVAWRSHLGT